MTKDIKDLVEKTKKIKHDKTKLTGPKTHKIITKEGKIIKYKFMNKDEFEKSFLENFL